jgi:hypothetical protein
MPPRDYPAVPEPPLDNAAIADKLDAFACDVVNTRTLGQVLNRR